MSVASSLRVFVVDDHNDTVVSTSLLLGIWGHEVRTALDGQTALVAAPLFRPHVMLIDLAMPELDGFRVARALRQLPEFAAVTLVAVSGYPDASHRRLATEAGFDEFLAKPYTIDELSAVLQRARSGRAQAVTTVS